MDLMFYVMETPENPKHVGALQIFELPRNAPPDYLVSLVAKLKRARVEPPFCFRPVFPLTGMPQWHEDEDIEIDYHVRHSALPKPGTVAQLLTVVERLHAGMLDRQRPGWICQVIEGLEGNRFAMYSKIHHAYIDGMSGARRMYGALSTSPTERDFVPVWAYKTRTPAPTRTAPGVARQVQQASRSALRQARAVSELSGNFARLGMQALKLRDGKVPVPFTAPRTLANRPVTWDTRSVGVSSLPLGRVREISRKMNGTINDVVLTLVDAALRDYLVHRGERIGEPLVALCPMSVRAKGDESANTQVATVHVRLGDPDASIRDRLAQIVESSNATKEDARSMSREALMDFVLVFAGVAELLTRSGMDQKMRPSYNVLVSNVPGPGDKAMYMAGSRLLAAYPISTLTPGVNLNATVISHGDSLDFGLLGDKHAIPDLSFVTQRIEHHFAELERAVSGAGRSTSASPGTRRRAAGNGRRAALRGAHARKPTPERPRASRGRSRRV